MTLTGANVFNDNNENTIYTINSSQNGQYCVVIPKSIENTISMIVDLSMKKDFDSLINNSISKENLIEKINNEYNNIKNNNKESILVLPMIDNNILTNAINSNDKQKIFDETKKIGGITSELYKNLIESGIEKNKINQKIMITEKNEIDTKFVEWLKLQMPNFIDGIKVTNTETAINNNPFEKNNPFLNEENKNEVSETNNLVNSESQEQTTPVENIPKEEPINNPVETNNSEATETTTEIKEPTPVQNISIAPSTEGQVDTTNNVIAPNPIPEQKNEIPTSNDNQINNIDKKSGGFANLLILLIVLAVVTVASIELGKFLFNTFGA